MRVEISSVSIPPMSTIGFGSGTEIETQEEILFCGDQHCMRAIEQALRITKEPVEAEVEEWQILSFGAHASLERRNAS